MTAMVSQINTMQDVCTFIDHIAKEVQDGNPFEEICRSKMAVDDNCLYTEQEATIRDKLMDRCFEVCTVQHRVVIYLFLVLFEEALQANCTAQVPT